MNQPQGDNKKSGRRDLTGFFVSGGPVQPGRGCYVRRAADRELGRLVRAGEYVQVLAPRHMGKSSLMARLAEELRAEGRHVAVVDLTQVGARERNDDLGRWFYSFAFRLIRQLRLKVDLQEWWQDKAVLTNRQRLTELYWDLVLESTTGPVTVFIDELQCLDNFAGVEQLLASIRAAHNARAAEPALARLNFVMLGVRIPEGFDADSEYSPFAVAQPVVLRDFRLHQLDVFGPALGLPRPQANQALERIYYWTNGQPYLSQKLARAFARARMRDDDLDDPGFIVDALTYRLYLNPASTRNEPHLSHLHRAMTEPRRDHDEILAVYGQVRKGGRVIVDPASSVQQRLVSEGLVVATRGGTLAVRNRIYHQVFTARWANEQLPFRWRRIASVAAAVIVSIVLPIWYSQSLPRPWTAVLTSQTATLQDARDAWQTLSRLPGHGADANRLFLDYLTRASRGAADVGSVQAADELLRQLPGAEPLADRLVAEFWDRQAERAEFRHERDSALLARLRSLVEPTIERRRRAAALVDADYEHLAATLRVTGGFDQSVLASSGRRLIAARGNTVHAWRIDQLPPVAEPAWEATALAFQPAVSRRLVEMEGRAGAGLSVELELRHDRPFDLSVTLTAPSGRSVTFQPGFADASLQRHRFTIDGGTLKPLIDEPRNGTWTLSVADRVQGVTGELSSWTIGFGNLRVEGTPGAPPLPLEDPLPEPDSTLVLGPAGRYAIAVPPVGDAAARVWDLSSRSAVSTLPISQSERVIGFVLDQRVVLVHGQEGIEAWTLSTGDPAELPGVGRQAVLSALSPDGGILALVGIGEERAVEAYDLIEGRLLGKTAPGVDHAAIAVAPGGRMIAVADPDRSIRLWRFGSDQPLAELDPLAPATGLAFAPDGRALSARLADGGLLLWRPGGGRNNPRRFPAPGPWTISFGDTGERLLLGTAAGGFRLLSASFADLDVPLLRGGFAAGTGAWSALHGNENLAVTGSPTEGLLRLWRLPARARSAPIPGGADRRIVATAVSADGTLMATGLLDGGLRLAAVGTDGVTTEEADEQRVDYFGHARPVCCVAFSRDGSVLATVAEDGSLRVWDTLAGEPRDFMSFQPTAHAVRRLAVSADGTRVAVVAGPYLRLWDSGTGTLIAEQQPGPAITALESEPDGRGFLLGDTAGTVWRLTLEPVRLERLYDAGSPVTALAATATGAPIAVATGDGGLAVVDPADRQLKGAAEPLVSAADTLVYSADGDHLLARSGHWLHRYRLSGYQLTPDGSRLLPAQPAGETLVPVDPAAEHVLVLTGSTTPTLVQLAFDAADASPLQGGAAALLESWQNRVKAGVISGPVPAESAPATRASAQSLPGPGSDGPP